MKKQTDVSGKVARLIVVGIRNVIGQLGKSGQNVLRSVGEAEGTELGNVRRKTNALDIVLRKEIATKMAVSGQLGPSPSVIVKNTDVVQKGTDVRETEKKQFQIVTKTMPSVKVGYRCTVHKL